MAGRRRRGRFGSSRGRRRFRSPRAAQQREGGQQKQEKRHEAWVPYGGAAAPAVAARNAGRRACLITYSDGSLEHSRYCVTLTTKYVNSFPGASFTWCATFAGIVTTSPAPIGFSMPPLIAAARISLGAVVLPSTSSPP